MSKDASFVRDRWSTTESDHDEPIWEQFRALDLKELASIMASSVIVDLRNIYAPEEAHRNGFHYCGVGRPRPLAY